MMSFSESIKVCLTKKYASASGRATRAEYWWFQLFSFLVTCLPLTIFIISEPRNNNAVITVFVTISIISFALLIPNTCVCIRRLHDRGLSGIYVLLPLLSPFIISITRETSLSFIINDIVIVGHIIVGTNLLLESENKSNKYGLYPFDTNDTLSCNNNQSAEKQQVEANLNIETTDVEL